MLKRADHCARTGAEKAKPVSSPTFQPSALRRGTMEIFRDVIADAIFLFAIGYSGFLLFDIWRLPLSLSEIGPEE